MIDARSVPRVSYAISRRSVNTLHVRDGVHQTGKYLILLFTQADLMLSVKQHMISLKDKCIVILPPDTPYSFSSGAVCRYLRVSFLPKDEPTEGILYEMTRKHQQLITYDAGYERDAVFHTAEQLAALNGEQQADDAFANDYGAVLMTKLLMDLSYRQMVLRRAAMTMDKPDLVEQITRYIRENYAKPISLEDISRLCFHSRYYVSRRFHKATGVTIVEYISQQRVRHACGQLSKSARSINDICYECGFRSLSHFYAVFRRLMGHSPLQYRKMIAKR